MSQRDVVFTPFMLRVRATLDGEATWTPPQLRPSVARRIAMALDEWFSLRTRAEQVIAEANAMLAGRAALVDLADEVGTGELAFSIHYGVRALRISLAERQRERQGWIELRRTGEPAAGSGTVVEPADVTVLEDMIIDLLWSERRSDHE